MSKMEKVMYIGNGFGSLTFGTKYNLIKEYDNDYLVFDDYGNEAAIPKKDFADKLTVDVAKHRAKISMMLKDGYNQKEQYDPHYDNSNGSLYLFAEKLNAWEFDIIKRVVRCREKGQFKEDLEKTVRVLELYAKEYKL
jgi:hypothetical protein